MTREALSAIWFLHARVVERTLLVCAHGVVTLLCPCCV